jgi:hypothetical protein
MKTPELVQLINPFSGSLVEIDIADLPLSTYISDLLDDELREDAHSQCDGTERSWWRAVIAELTPAELGVIVYGS